MHVVSSALLGFGALSFSMLADEHCRSELVALVDFGSEFVAIEFIKELLQEFVIIKSVTSAHGA